jgi:hypothetical protein
MQADAALRGAAVRPLVLKVTLLRVPGAPGQPPVRMVEVMPDADVPTIISAAYRGQARGPRSPELRVT